MKIIKSQVSGQYLDLLIDFGGGEIVAARTAVEQFELRRPFRSGGVDGEFRLRLFALASVPDDWREHMDRAAIAAPRKELPRP